MTNRLFSPTEWGGRVLQVPNAMKKHFGAGTESSAKLNERFFVVEKIPVGARCHAGEAHFDEDRARAFEKTLDRRLILCSQLGLCHGPQNSRTRALIGRRG